MTPAVTHHTVQMCGVCGRCAAGWSFIQRATAGAEAVWGIPQRPPGVTRGLQSQVRRFGVRGLYPLRILLVCCLGRIINPAVAIYSQFVFTCSAQALCVDVVIASEIGASCVYERQ